MGYFSDGIITKKYILPVSYVKMFELSYTHVEIIFLHCCFNNGVLPWTVFFILLYLLISTHLVSVSTLCCISSFTCSSDLVVGPPRGCVFSIFIFEALRLIVLLSIHYVHTTVSLILPPFYVVQVMAFSIFEAACFCEPLVSFYITIQCQT